MRCHTFTAVLHSDRKVGQVHEYQRFTPLMVESRGLERGYLDVQPGDCVVAFSRKDIYDIKQLIEAGTGQRWASSAHVTFDDAAQLSSSLLLRPQIPLQA